MNIANRPNIIVRFLARLLRPVVIEIRREAQNDTKRARQIKRRILIDVCCVSRGPLDEAFSQRFGLKSKSFASGETRREE